MYAKPEYVCSTVIILAYNVEVFTGCGSVIVVVLSTGPEVIIFFGPNQTELEISTAHKIKIPPNKEVACFKSLRCCIYHAKNVKMPTIVGILSFMSRINSALS